MTARELSFWGWGYTDRFPDDAARKGLAQLAAAMLGGGEFELRAPPALDAVRMPAPRVAAPMALAAVATDAAADRASHTYGKSYRDLARGFAGDFSPAPDLVVRPRSEDEIERLLDWAAGAGVAVIPFGGGTSVVGGVEGRVGERYHGVVSLDLRGLDRVLEIDDVSRAARIQAGATGPVLESQLSPSGLSLRHYPQSFEFSTLGGWIATRAGGHFATVYTHIDDLVESVRMVSPVGRFESRRLPGSGAGPSPDRMVIGSEGILGVITEAWVRLHPRPRWRAQASAVFDDFARAVDATRAIAQSGLYPANCRLLDSREAMLHRVRGDGKHVLLLGFESADHPVDAWIDRAVAIVADHGGTVPEGITRKDAGDRAREGNAASWRQAFLDMPYMFNAMVSMGVVVDTFETACTWDRFDELHGAVISAVRGAMKQQCGTGLITCRFTHVYPDGPAPYYTFIAPGRRGAELEQHAAIKRAASDALIAHGGTITHHHAVGREHRPWYDRQRPDPFARALEAAKQALDPSGVLNPGVLIDPPSL